MSAVRPKYAAGFERVSTRALTLRAPNRQLHKARRNLMVASHLGEKTIDELGPMAETYSQMKVSEFMTAPALSFGPDVSVENAIELLVNKGISGLPVTDQETGKVLGVVSGFDIIALDKTPGHIDRSDGMFPKIGNCGDMKYRGNSKKMWREFLDLKEVAARASSQTVGQIMHDAYTVNRNESMEEAASLVIRDKVHRLTVLDDEGRLVGVLSRGDIMRATLLAMQANIQKGNEVQE